VAGVPLHLRRTEGLRGFVITLFYLLLLLMAVMLLRLTSR
jgi:hypothetical protein